MSNLTIPILRPLKAIRAKCLDCVCDQVAEVRACPSKTCSLWMFRMGHRPTPADIKESTAALTKANSRKDSGARK